MTTTPDCKPCAEGARFLSMSRRGFFTLAGAAGIVMGTTVGGARVGLLDGLTPRAGAATATDTDCLVVLSLRGGYDGLSCIVPGASPEYYDLRPDINVPQSLLKQVNDGFGLAPALEPLYGLWDSGQLGAVHAVGMERPNYSHFAAMDEMERASTNSSLYTGWIDRCVGALGASDSPFLATAMGTDTLPTSLSGPNPEFAMRNIAGVTLAIGENEGAFAAVQEAMTRLHEGSEPLVSDPVLRGIGAVAAVETLPEGGDGYPDTGLANALKDVARLIKEPTSGIRFATVDYGGWDTHEGQGGPTDGNYFGKMRELAESLAAFATDLGPALDRTTLITLTEFGRPLRQNGSGGTDHGYGFPVLMLGGGVEGGRVHGTWPGLAEDALVDGNLAATTDYRALVSEILGARCGVSDTAAVFPGMTAAQPMGVVRSR
ncbi:MAG: DUF1501 domain-containing protein [Kineosporiaceae bacterium]